MTRTDRYISFENIDCFENACVVIDRLFELTADAQKTNRYFEKIKSELPDSYGTRTFDERILYLVCSSVFYLEELFEKWEFQPGLDALSRCELECC